MYTEKARELRRCKARTIDGRRCRCFAVWGDPLNRCKSHGGFSPRGRWRRGRTPAPCRCPAYAWPHRPGSGLCCWPDPPQAVSRLPAGTHAEQRMRGRYTDRSIAEIADHVRRCYPDAAVRFEPERHEFHFWPGRGG